MYNFAFPLFRRSPREPVWTVQTQIGIFQINQLFFYNSQMQRSVYPHAATKTAEWPDTKKAESQRNSPSLKKSFS